MSLVKMASLNPSVVLLYTIPFLYYLEAQEVIFEAESSTHFHPDISFLTLMALILL